MGCIPTECKARIGAFSTERCIPNGMLIFLQLFPLENNLLKLNRDVSLQFIARGSKAELETQLLICVEIGYLNETEILEAMNLLTETGKMLNSLINKLRT